MIVVENRIDIAAAVRGDGFEIGVDDIGRAGSTRGPGGTLRTIGRQKVHPGAMAPVGTKGVHGLSSRSRPVHARKPGRARAESGIETNLSET
jgi:hypothetical protein